MCGIAGEIRFTGHGSDGPDVEAVARITAAMAPRGPDGSGLHAAGSIALGHRRLVRQAGCAGRHLVAVADRHDGEPARFVLGGLQQIAHHRAIALLEHVQRQDEPGKQHRVQREEWEPDGGHDAKS